MMRDIRPIQTEADYDWALVEVENYFQNEPVPGSPEADRFNVLSSLIEAYEAKHWPIETPDPIEAIRHVLETTDKRQSDLARIFGSRSRASEILNRRRPLTLSMIKALHEHWKLPADVLIKPYHLARDKTPQKGPGKAASRR